METELELSEQQLTLPIELIDSIVHHSTPLMATLAHTNTGFYSRYQPELNERAPKQLMAYVLNPTTENILKAKAMIAANPRFMFIKTNGYEPASGIEEYNDELTGEPRTRIIHRGVICSPFQAALGTGDSEIYNYMAEYFDKVEDGIALAQKQMQEKFPNGFAYPPSTYDFTPIVDAIRNDQTLIETGVPSDETKAILAQFRKDFLPKDVTQGHHFNPNDLIKAFEAYDQHGNLWNGNQLSLFWCQAIGFIERQITVVDAQAFSEGVDNHLENKAKTLPHGRSLVLYNYQSRSNISYFGDSPQMRGLGFDFGIYIDWAGLATGARVAGLGYAGVFASIIQMLCRAKTSELGNFKRHVEHRASQATGEQQHQAVRNSLM